MKVFVVSKDCGDYIGWFQHEIIGVFTDHEYAEQVRAREEAVNEKQYGGQGAVTLTEVEVNRWDGEE